MKKYLGIFLLTILILSLSLTKIWAQNDTGWLKFKFNTDSAFVVPGNDLLDAIKLSSGDSLKFNSGIRLMSFQTHFDKSETVFIQIFTDSTVTYNHKFKDRNFRPDILTDNVAARRYYDANVIVLTDEDSDIYYNGEYQGTGFAKINTGQEIGNLKIENPDFGQSKRRLNVPEPKITFVEKKLRPVKSESRFFSILPGVSQLYKKQHVKAFLFGASAVSLFTFAGIKSKKYNKELDVFHELDERYENATTEQEALRFGDLAENQLVIAEDINNQRKVLFLSGILIYAYNIYDAFTSHPAGGYMKDEKDLEFYLSQENVSGNVRASGTFRYNF